MTVEPEADLPPELQELIVDLLDGRCAKDDPRVAAATAARPDFARQLAGARMVRDRVLEQRELERATLAAPPSDLDAFATARARAGLGLKGPASAEGRGRRPWLRWSLALAAAAMLAVMLWQPWATRRPSGIYLHGDFPLQRTPAGTLELGIELEPGQSLVLDVLDPAHLEPPIATLPVRGATLPVPDATAYPAGVLLRVRLLDPDGKTTLGTSDVVELRAGTGR